METPTHIFFDVDGVLINGFHASPEQRLRWDRNMQADLGIDPTLFESSFFKQAWADVIIGRQPLLPALAPVLAQLNPAITPQQMMDYWFTQDARLNPYVMDFARTLSATYPVFIATNQEHQRAAYLWDTLGFSKTFRQIFYSANLGLKKENPDFFRHICKALNIPPNRALIIDDTLNVIESAQSTGWQTFHLSSPEKLAQLHHLLSPSPSH